MEYIIEGYIVCLYNIKWGTMTVEITLENQAIRQLFYLFMEKISSIIWLGAKMFETRMNTRTTLTSVSISEE